ncbi:DUF551 domain-containing protein [Serratia marcescens]|uniref:DUF551 domain-containing protein n=1 Tax=Serratia marcescens TaxID=615 RepID=UPI003FA76359
MKHLASSDNANELTRRLARECLANREAQPVAWRHDDGPFAGIAITRSKSVADSWIAKGWTVTPLYTAPPAPDNANPVAWEMRYWNSGHNCWHYWERITAEQHAEMSAEHATSNDYEFRVLYDAPPAPAVTDESDPRDAFESVFPMPKYVVRCGTGYAVTAYSAWGAHDFKERWEGWNACRAAMLAQPVSSGCKFPEEWIACSDRMPDETQPVIVVSDGGVVQRTVYQFCDGVWSDWYDEHDHLNADTFTHWMPLPAAPETSHDNS